MTENVNDMLYYLQSKNRYRAPHIGDIIDQYGDVAGSALNTIVPGAGQAFSQVFGTISHWVVSAITPPRWSGLEKDLAKLFMVVTGRSLVNNNADVGANGQVLQGEPIEYTQHLPEAITYFSLKNGRLIDTREKALATLGESWSNGLWSRIYGRDRNWKNVFTAYGLPAPTTPYVFGKSGFNYNPVVEALKAGRVNYLTSGGQTQYTEANPLYASYSGNQAAGSGSGTGSGTGSGNYNPPDNNKSNSGLIWGGIAVLAAIGIGAAAGKKNKKK